MIIRLLCNNFKIRNFVEEYCKILYICMFFFGQYMKFYFYYTLYNLSFIMTTLEKISRATVANRIVLCFYKLLLIITFPFILKNKSIDCLVHFLSLLIFLDDYFKLSQFSCNFLTFPYNSHPSPLKYPQIQPFKMFK